MYKFQTYTNQEREWNTFNDSSKNGTFLFNRSYMEYHKDRFDDFSLLIYDDKDALVGLLPLNRKNDQVFSHQGLTYGGFVTDARMTTCKMVHLFQELQDFLREHQITSLLYKTMPLMYLDFISQEDHYALFLQNAQLVRRDVISLIDYSASLPVQERRIRSRKKAEKENFTIHECHHFADFWALLTHVLKERHNVTPTHSLEEITHLASLFPNNIRLFTCQNAGEILAGVVLYINKHTVHAQYIAASDKGLNTGGLDLLFFHLIEKFRERNKYFSFGISNENNGKHLNEGLIAQKEGFGARSIVHDTYWIPLNER